MRKGKFRIVEASTGKIAKNKGGTAIDGGGHATRESCMKQASAVNANINSKYNDIFVHGIIGVDVTGKSILDELEAAKGGKPIRVRINSKGGSAPECIDIFNKINSFSEDVITYVEGVALSAAAILAHAGKEVHMAENSLLMYHKARFENIPGTLHAEDLRSHADALDKFNEVLVKTLVATSNKSKEDVEKMLEKDSWFTAKEALKAGFISKIVPISMKYNPSNFKGIPDKIVAYVNSLNPMEDEMDVLKLASDLNVKVEKDAKEEDVLKGIVAHFNSLTEELKKLKEELTKATKEPDKKEPIASGILSMARKYRETEINGLIGKITPAVAKELEKEFCSDEALNNALTNTGEATDNFEKMMTIIKENEDVIALEGSSGVQPLPKDKDKPEESVLVKNMEARSKV